MHDTAAFIMPSQYEFLCYEQHPKIQLDFLILRLRIGRFEPWPRLSPGISQTQPEGTGTNWKLLPGHILRCRKVSGVDHVHRTWHKLKARYCSTTTVPLCHLYLGHQHLPILLSTGCPVTTLKAHYKGMIG